MGRCYLLNLRSVLIQLFDGSFLVFLAHELVGLDLRVFRNEVTKLESCFLSCKCHMGSQVSDHALIEVCVVDIHEKR